MRASMLDFMHDAFDRVHGIELAMHAIMAKLHEIEQADTVDFHELIDMQPEIDHASAEITAHARQCERIVGKCLSLQPSPSTYPPHGF